MEKRRVQEKIQREVIMAILSAFYADILSKLPDGNYLKPILENNIATIKKKLLDNISSKKSEFEKFIITNINSVKTIFPTIKQHNSKDLKGFHKLLDYLYEFTVHKGKMP